MTARPRIPRAVPEPEEELGEVETELSERVSLKAIQWAQSLMPMRILRRGVAAHTESPLAP